MQNDYISKRAEQGLRYQLKKYALEKCRDRIEAYVACTQDKLISVVWKCRGLLNEMDACLQSRNNEVAFEKLKRRWIESGQSRTPDWKELLDGLDSRGN